MQWRITLQFAIVTQEPLTSEQDNQIRNPTLCSIGRWLLSETTQPFRAHPDLLHLAQMHLHFHQQMEHIADLIAERRFTDAARSIETASSFDRASQALAMSIMAFDRIFKIQVSP